jgi:hypothetical protein
VGEAADTPLRKFVVPGLAVVVTLQPELAAIVGRQKASTRDVVINAFATFALRDIGSPPQ